MVAHQPPHAAFASRLSEALTDAGIPDNRARRRIIAKLFSVSREAARKWLAGETRPTTQRVEEIATKLDCNGEWLLTGRGLKRSGANNAPADAEPDMIIREGAIDYIVEINGGSRTAISADALTAAQQLDSLPPDIARQMFALIEACARHDVK